MGVTEKAKGVTSAGEVANYLLWFSADHGDCLTNLKLQKLLYYAQAWYLALYDEPLFDQEIEAWVHGPVVPTVYHRFSNYKADPIPVDSIPKARLSKKVQGHLEEILRVFGGFSAYQLEKLTHQEAPWRNARKGLPIDEASRSIISKNDMKRFYRELANANE